MGEVLNSTERAWCDELLLALRFRDVPGPRIGEVLAEVQSHLAETGEDPRTAFGPPKQYADEVAEALGTGRRSLSHVLRSVSGGDLAVTVACGVGSFLLADGLWSLGAGERAVLGLSAWLTTAVAVLVLGLCVLLIVVHARQDRGDAVIDPRTGEDMAPFAQWRIAVLAGVPVLLLAGMLVGGLLTR